MTVFSPDWIKAGFSRNWCTEGVSHQIAKASTFDKNMDLSTRENKVVIGLLVGITTPSKGTAFGMRFYNGNGAKRTKLSGIANYAFIMVFADVFDLPNCFAVILH